MLVLAGALSCIADTIVEILLFAWPAYRLPQRLLVTEAWVCLPLRARRCFDSMSQFANRMQIGLGTLTMLRVW